MTADASAGKGRHLSLAGWAAIVVAYLSVLKLTGLLVAPDDAGIGEIQTDEEVLRAFVIPIGVSLLFAAAVTSRLGWWRPVLVEERRVQRWVLIVPAIFLVAILIAISYGELADRTMSFVALLLLGMLFVGAAEELMFRGLGVHVLRQNGMTEARVALWSSVVFGLVHLSNAISAGGGAVGQAIAVSFAGYFFYLTRRATGTLLVGAVIHGLFDFSIITGELTGELYAGTLVVGAVIHGLFDFSITTGELTGELYAGTVAALLVYPVVGAIVLIGRRRIEPG